MTIQNLIVGLVLASIISWLAYRAGTLTRGGAAAATLVGAAVYQASLAAGLLLVLFFISSSALTRFKASTKNHQRLGFAKSGQRDGWQVIANGGIAALCAVSAAFPGSSLARAGLIGALAAAAADTWGTEIGVLSSKPPRALLTGRSVARGTSGAVSRLGIGASLLGSLVIGGMGVFVLGDGRAITVGLVGGMFGALADSLLGGSLQVMYACETCHAATELHPEHHCGSPTTFQRGWRWLNNDGVNFLATLTGAAVSIGLASLWQ